MKEMTAMLANQHWREINPVQFGWEACDPGHGFGPASRTFYLLHYVISGKGVFIREEKSYTLTPGQIFVIRPYEITRYEADSLSPWHYTWIGFDCGVRLPEALQQDVLSLPSAGPLFASMREVFRMETGLEQFLCGKIWELLALLEAGIPHAPNARDYIETAKTYIETEYMRGVSIADLARRLHLDRSYFSSLFKRKTGQSPQQYLTEYRLKKAAELIVNHGCTPGEAAASTGYADIFSFSRMFKRKFGVSPSRYGQSLADAGQQPGKPRPDASSNES